MFPDGVVFLHFLKCLLCYFALNRLLCTLNLDHHFDFAFTSAVLHLQLNIWKLFARRTTHLGNLVVDTESGVTEQRGIRAPQHGTLCE